MIQIMKPEIIDLTKPEPHPKPINPIRLTHCLQASTNGDGQPFFFRSTYSIDAPEKIIRLGTQCIDSVEFDLISIQNSRLTQYFLGHWNDGVL